MFRVVIKSKHLKIVIVTRYFNRALEIYRDRMEQFESDNWASVELENCYYTDDNGIHYFHRLH